MGHVSMSTLFDSSVQPGSFSIHSVEAVAAAAPSSSTLQSYSTTSIMRNSAQLANNPEPLTNGITHQFKSSMAVIFLCVPAALLTIKILAWYMKKRNMMEDNNNMLHGELAAAGRTEVFKGVDCEVLKHFPIIKYSCSGAGNSDLEEGKRGSLQCAVCLTEFRQNENIRLLPQCHHSFHPQCIDTWLSGHTTCPLCRISLVHIPKYPAAKEQREAEQQAGEASTPAVSEDPQAGAAIQPNCKEYGGVERARQSGDVNLAEYSLVVVSFESSVLQEGEMEESMT